jgi:selenocysteine lyase/cysteine desulfurase
MTTIDEYADQFEEEPGYLDFARVGPMGRAAAEEEQAHVELLRRARFGSIDRFLDEHARVREVVADLTGFSAEQVAFQPNTSTGLMHAMFGLTGGVLLSGREFPSLTFAAVRASEALGVVVPQFIEWDDDVNAGRVTPGIVKEQLTPKTVAVAVSLVDYRTGYLADLEGIRQVIGDRLLIVDAVQGFGVVDAPYEVADVIASGGQKWVRAGWGNGFLAMSDRALDRLTPVFSGFVVGEEFPDGPDIPAPPSGINAFQVSYGSPVAQARFASALESIAAVGVDTVNERIAERVDRVIELADEFAIPVSSPRDRRERAGIVVLEPAPDQLTVLAAALFNQGVSATVRDGHVRLSAHVSTSDETLGMLRMALAAFATSTTI